MPERLSLIQAPTPVHRLDRMSERLGIDLWIKRDDLTGFALGGNKGRKLEYLIPDIIAQEANVVVTSGATQSNFVRQLGTACAIYGIRCVATTMALPYDAPAGKPDAPPLGKGGNRFLDEMVGVELHEFADGPWEELYDRAEELAAEEESKGNAVYRMPSGGSTELGACSFLEAGRELMGQLDSIDAVVHATSSGSTQAGLACAFRGSGTRVIGICADPEPDFAECVVDLANRLEALLGSQRSWSAADMDCRLGWTGPGYGVPSKEGNEAILDLVKTEGIFLDPIYTGKAFAGLMELAQSKEICGKIVFWHTGGLPTLFA